MKSLKEAKIEAQILCGRTKQSVDVYKTDAGYRAKRTALRKSNIFELRMTVKDEIIIIKNAKGDTKEKIEIPKKEEGQAETTETAEVEQSDNKPEKKAAGKAGK